MLGKTNVKIKPNKKVDYVEYIESTGTQYIDTGYYPSSNSRVEFGFMPTATTLTATNTKILQASSGASTPSFSACFAGGGGTAGNARFTFGSTYSYYVDITGLNNNNRKDMIMDCMASTVTANGEQTYNVTKTSFECTETLKVFERGGGCVGRLYYLRIYENNTLVHDFKACKDGAGVYCLYDEVEKRYYYNQGTGNFTGYAPTKLEYIENTGTQYIDTGIIPTTNTSVNLVYKAIKNDDSQYVLGCRQGTTSGTIHYAINGSASRSDWDIRLGGVTKYSNVQRTTDKYRSTIQLTNGNGNWKLTNLDTGTTNTFEISNISINANSNLFLFAYSDKAIHDGLRIYECKIYEAGVLIRDYIPVLDKENTPCLYDKLNKTYYYNKGTGSFLGGASI